MPIPVVTESPDLVNDDNNVIHNQSFSIGNIPRFNNAQLRFSFLADDSSTEIIEVRIPIASLFNNDPGSALELVSVSNPQGGRVEIDEDEGVVIFTHEEGSSEGSFEYTATNGTDIDTATAKVSIDVDGVSGGSSITQEIILNGVALADGTTFALGGDTLIINPQPIAMP